MQSDCPKRAPLLTAVAGAVVVAMAAPAFACTAFLGKVTVTATGAGAAGSGTYEGDNSDQTTASKGYCATPSRTNLTTLGTFRLDVWRDSSCTTVNLPADTYQVRAIGASADTGATHASQFSCNGLPDPTQQNPWTVIGTLVVGNSLTAAYSGEYALPAKIGKVNVCLDPPLTSPNNNISPPMVFLNLI